MVIPNSSWGPQKMCKILLCVSFQYSQAYPLSSISPELPSQCSIEQFVLLAAAELFSGTFCRHHHADSLTPTSPHSRFHFGKAHPLLAPEKRSMKRKVSKASHFLRFLFEVIKEKKIMEERRLKNQLELKIGVKM